MAMEISRQTKITAGALVGAVAIVLLSTVIFDLSLERAILLAPVLVVAFGIIVGLAVFWWKVALQQWRGDDSKRKS
jgi:nitrogen fixation-related uncharacterized protein